MDRKFLVQIAILVSFILFLMLAFKVGFIEMFREASTFYIKSAATFAALCSFAAPACDLDLFATYRDALAQRRASLHVFYAHGVLLELFLTLAFDLAFPAFLVLLWPVKEERRLQPMAVLYAGAFFSAVAVCKGSKPGVMVAFFASAIHSASRSDAGETSERSGLL